LLRSAEQDAARIEREQMPWSNPIAQLIRAGLATVRGNRSEATEQLGSAVSSFDATDMGQFAAAARRRLGELLADDSGAKLIDEAGVWIAGQRIENPARMTALYAPGFPK
jgi:hypothetical protein